MNYLTEHNNLSNILTSILVYVHICTYVRIYIPIDSAHCELPIMQPYTVRGGAHVNGSIVSLEDDTLVVIHY